MALTAHGFRLGFALLLLFALLLGTASPAKAATVMCSQFGGVVDGSNPATFAAVQSASSFGIDMNCTIKNFPQSLGGFPITNINFNFPQHQSYYIAFLNVFYYGHMSCNDPTQSDFWIYWAPGGFSDISPSCQAFMVPVDAVLKKNPPAQTTAAIGVPFTYTITMPLMGKLDSTGTFQYIADADDSPITNAVITDDLTATGAVLSYVSNTAYLVNPGTGTRTPLNGGLPLALGASSTWLANHAGILSDSTKHLVFSYEYNAALASIPAGYNIEIDLTVVLDNNPANVAQTQFSNTANMWFNKTINTTNMVDLQAQPGTTLPMTIVVPNLVVTKTSSVSNLNVGTQAPYTINVQNTGGSDAWNATVTDNIPAGMCTYDPRSTVTAQIFASDGVTPVSGPLVNGADFSVTWNGGTASACQLSLQMLTAAAKIGPNQRLIINYQAMLDAGISGGTFTNVAGATRWFSAASGYAGRLEYDRTLTTGTPGVLDFQDAYTITAAVAGYYFLKSVDDLTTGAYPATVAFPGDRLRYTLQIQNFNIPPLNNITVNDDLGALNGFTAFIPGSLALAGTNLPAGTYTICSTCGTNGAGTVTINGLTLGSNVQYQIQFDVTLASSLTNGANVRNQASLAGIDSNNNAWSGVSDAPYLNGPALLGTPSDITPVLIQAPGALSKTSPAPSTATIGQQFSYVITVPAVAASMPLYDVHILDNLPANVSFVSAQVVAGGMWNLTNTGTATSLVIQDTTTGIDIPAGGQAVVRITVAMQNITANSSGVSFTNSASYTYNKLNGGGISTQGTGGAGVSTPMNVIEPHLTATKTMSYATPAGKPAGDPAAPGDVLQYTITIPNSGSSTAFDADVMDTLPANVSLVPGSATATIGGAPVAGFAANPTALPGGTLAWGRQNGDETLDIPAGQSLVLTYRVTVLSVNGTPITNSVSVDWTSLNDDITGERTGAGCPAWTSPNNYCYGPVSATPVPTIDPTALAKSVVSDSWNPGNDSVLRIGDTVVYSLALTLREGVTQNVVVTDTLPIGLAFDSFVSITPASGSSNFTYAVAFQPAPGATGTLTWNLGNISNAVDNNPANNTLVIQYRARVLKNTLTQTPTAQTLTNNAALNYAVNGVAATPKTSSATITVLKPMLNVSKSAAPAAGGTVLSANELVTYTVNIQNTGNAPAYDTVLQDVIPVGMRNGAATITMVSVSLVNAGTTLPNVAPTFSPATGVAVWNFDSGVANQYGIPSGDTLRVVYRVQTAPNLGAGMTLVNAAQVQHYYSFDSQAVPNGSTLTDRQDFGATSVATVQLTTASAMALSKQNLVTTAAIGQPFTYRITVPATLQPTAMYDVRVLDNLSLAATGVNMSFVGVQRVSGPTFTPVNTGTATNLVIQDTTNGIDIPAGQQVVLDVAMVLNDDIVNNTAGKLFQNTATYTYNSVNANNATVANGAPGTSGAIAITSPNLTMQKSGPSAMRAGVPGTFRLNVQNIGTATAWNTTLTDILPMVTSPAAGGMCVSAPTNVTARIYQADGVTPVSAQLANGTDFLVNFAGAPACTWTIAMRSSAAAVPASDRLIVTYSTLLDPGTASNLALTNIAGATQWLSADPTVPGASGHVHTSASALTNGTPGVVDYQDAFTVTTESPVLTFTKTVYNVTTGQSGANARPGDTLKYTLTIQNVSTVNATSFSLTDELDRLNTTAMFMPGSLTLVTVPAGANTSQTSATGGARGTGLVSISNLSIAPQGGVNDKLVIEFQARLVPVITSGTVIVNQAQIGSSTLPTQLSDDPSLAGTSDPTSTRIASAPAFRVVKTAQDITSGAATVMAGDTLRYTITVKNIGTENAIGVTLRDQIPANTSYVANSTRLNGAVVADAGGGVSALQNGMSISSPVNPTAGAMPADAGATTTNVATVTFDVRINTSVVNGTIISNQGYVNGSGGGSGTFPEQPSDNPATPVLNDPTTVVVGNLPLVSALKTVQLVVDNNNNGNVDPGDVLQYTITLTNSGATPATGVVLTDAIPANTTYVANSVVMNGGAVADTSAGVSPLINGIGVVSSGQTLPSPPSSGGTLAAGGTGIVTFKVQVNAGVPFGTLISNQGSVASAQLPTFLTDADGNPTNGFQPTVVTVGNAQQLTITKQVAVVGGGTAEVGAELEYVVRVTNIGTVAATSVVITDALPGQLSLVPGSVVLDGQAKWVTIAGPVIIADYSLATGGSLPANGTVILRFRAKIVSGSIGATLTNNAQVTWDTPSQNAQASASVDIGGTPGSVMLNGLVWHDANFNKICDSNERDLTGWTVQVYRQSQMLGSAQTGTNGAYGFSGLAPTTTAADQYEVRFIAPGAGANTALLGLADSPFTNSLQRISGISAASGRNLQNLNLPIDPSGVIYDSIRRTPIAGATVTMVRAATNSALPASCFADPAQQNQVTLAPGYYKFDLNFSDPSCPSGADYLIRVTPPANGYRPMPSRVIAPTTSETTAPFSVPGCPGSADDAIPATASFCEAQPSEFAPATNIPAGSVGTKYYLHFMLSNSAAGSIELFNNHIPVDPPLNTAVTISKTALLLNVSRGQMVPYVITVKNTLGGTLSNLSVADRFPPGFKYVAGSARFDGIPLEPVKTTSELRWENLQLTDGDHIIKLLLVVGAGVKEGDYDNSAQVLSSTTGEAMTTVATARVRIVPDPTFDCTDIIGKVFDDANANGYPDRDEKGLGGVRIVSARGLIATTDNYGRFHITCAAVPNEDRGSNFILKVDDRTLPTGYRITTENPLVHRLTRGKAIKFNFGATLHRVVRLDIADGVFEPGSTEMREQWKPRIEMLLGELRKAPAILRVSYLADVEDPKVVKARTEAVKREIADRWEQGPYELTIETEIFWRRGGPPARRPVANDGQ